MAHPHKADVEDSHNAKMRRMTMHYGEADPKANFKAPSEKYKLEGPEPHVGFGADNSAVNARSDKPARRSLAANPIATYKKGGKVKHRDSGGDVSTIEEANKDQAATQGRARGGRLHHKGKGSTHVNVMIAPQGGAGAGAPPPIPPQLAGALAKPPMAGPPPGGPPMPPPGAGGPPPGGMPPGGPPPMMRKRGGKVHADEVQDKALIKKELKAEGLVRKARGGALHMTGGSLSGPGREEKNKFQKHHGDKSAPEI